MAKGFYVGINNVARKIKEGYVGVGGFTPRELPDGYTQVEYIESAGSQYIDTGFVPNQDIKVVVDSQITSINTGEEANAIFGARNADGTNTLHWFWHVPNNCFLSGYKTGSSYKFEVDALTRRVMTADKNVFTTDGASYTHTYATFQGSYNLTFFALNHGGTVKFYAKARMYSCQIYDNGTIVRDYVPVKNSSGEVGLFDMITQTFYTNAGTGTFTAGSSNPNAAVARRIKEAFIGIGGVARPCWYEGTLGYYGTITSLSTSILSAGVASVGDYALFGGGTTYTSSGTEPTGVVNAYSKSLTRTVPTALYSSVDDLAATSVGGYALFGGGHNGTFYYTTMNAYNESLTMTKPTVLSVGRAYLSAASIGSYALFSGGKGSSGYSNTVDAYNESLTRTTPTALNVGRYMLEGVSVGDYALFGGGSGSTTNAASAVDAYSKSLTRTTATSFTTGRRYHAAASVGNYALFGGGEELNSVEAYNKSLTRTNPTVLSANRYAPAGASFESYAMFAGGWDYTNYLATVDVYDDSLTRTEANSLSVGRSYLAASRTGDYMLFGGGYSSGNYLTTVDAYVIS